MSQAHPQLQTRDEEADEGFMLHAGEFDSEDLIDELEDEGLIEEEAIEQQLEEEFGVAESDEPEAEARPEDPEDVEASLDEVLLVRTLGEEELEAHPEPVEHFNEDVLVPGRHRDEFLCRSCFLVKSRSQLADRHRHVCLDCV